MSGRGLERDPVPNLADERVEPLLVLESAVGVPPGEFVERVRPRIVLEHPQNRLRKALLAEAIERLGHESTTDSVSPQIRMHVDGVELADGLRLVSRTAEVGKAYDLAIERRHKSVHAL